MADLTPDGPFSAPSPPVAVVRGLGYTTIRIVALKIMSGLAVAVVVTLTARGLGPSGRGSLVLLLTVASFGVIVASLGANYGARIELVAPSPVPTSSYAGLTLALGGLQAGLCAVAGVTLLPAAGVSLGAPDLLLFSSLSAAQILQYLMCDALNAYGHNVEAAVVDTLGFLVQVGLVGVVVLGLGADTLRPVVAIFLAAGAVQYFVAVWLLARSGHPVRPRYDRDHWRRLVRTGLPGVGAGLGQVLTFRIDRYLVGLFLTPAAVGIYSVAGTATEFLRLPSLAAGQPIFYRVASGASTPRDFGRARAGLLALTAGLGAALFVLCPTLIRNLFGPEFSGAVTPLRILLVGELGITLYNVDASALGGLGRVGAASLAALAGLLVVAVLDLALIPGHGLAGAAWASVVAYGTMGLGAAVMLRRAVSGRGRPPSGRRRSAG